MRHPKMAKSGTQISATLHIRMTIESDGPEARAKLRTNTGEIPQVNMAKARAKRAVVLEVIMPIKAMALIWSMVPEAGEI